MKRAKTISPVSQNFVTVDTPQKDVDNYITPAYDENIFWVPDGLMTMEDVVYFFRKFPSKGQARKAGWSGPIPPGFNVWQIGKDQFVTLRGIDEVIDE